MNRYNNKLTSRQIENLLKYTNSINSKIKFKTLELEQNNSINFLDLTITKNNNTLEYEIYRKQTTTDTVIHVDSYYPYNQKMAALKSFIHRLMTIPLSTQEFQNELHILKYIATKHKSLINF